MLVYGNCFYDVLFDDMNLISKQETKKVFFIFEKCFQTKFLLTNYINSGNKLFWKTLSCSAEKIVQKLVSSL